jgi:hypothetical protein
MIFIIVFQFYFFTDNEYHYCVFQFNSLQTMNIIPPWTHALDYPAPSPLHMNMAPHTAPIVPSHISSALIHNNPAPNHAVTPIHSHATSQAITPTHGHAVTPNHSHAASHAMTPTPAPHLSNPFCGPASGFSGFMPGSPITPFTR